MRWKSQVSRKSHRGSMEDQDGPLAGQMLRNVQPMAGWRGGRDPRLTAA